jgi:hypothetical protein
LATLHPFPLAVEWATTLTDPARENLARAIAALEASQRDLIAAGQPKARLENTISRATTSETSCTGVKPMACLARDRSQRHQISPTNFPNC